MKVRGFEKISYQQFKKDFGDYNGTKDLYDKIMLPYRNTKYSAGYDFYSPFDFILKPNEKIIIPTGIKAYMQNDEYLGIYNRSSMGFKYNIRLCNQVGIIDADYYDNDNNEGHIFISYKNEGDKDWIVKQNDKIAQGIFNKYLMVDNETIPTRKRTGGIGTTNERR